MRSGSGLTVGIRSKAVEFDFHHSRGTRGARRLLDAHHVRSSVDFSPN